MTEQMQSVGTASLVADEWLAVERDGLAAAKTAIGGVWQKLLRALNLDFFVFNSPHPR
ncbi:MAG: hypothetical protein JO025_07045 [Verrucomicrobia bacterium]|nr:hypothetical protein [Verrucomicrobiota bacterium]